MTPKELLVPATATARSWRGPSTNVHTWLDLHMIMARRVADWSATVGNNGENELINAVIALMFHAQANRDDPALRLRYLALHAEMDELGMA